jgi:hypothetical protein
MSSQPPHTEPAFYVVSPGKLTLLFFATQGLYGLYWFFRHWQLQDQQRGKRSFPLIRAIFGPLTMPWLCQNMVRFQQTQESDGHLWYPGWIGMGSVATQLVASILTAGSLLEWFEPSLLVMLLLLMPQYYFLYQFQLVANRSCQDPFGNQNAQFTPFNHGWMVFGLLQWAQLLYAVFFKASGAE